MNRATKFEKKIIICTYPNWAIIGCIRFPSLQLSGKLFLNFFLHNTKCKSCRWVLYILYIKGGLLYRVYRGVDFFLEEGVGGTFFLNFYSTLIQIWHSTTWFWGTYFFPNFALHTFSPISVLSELKQQGSTKVIRHSIFMMYK